MEAHRSRKGGALAAILTVVAAVVAVVLVAAIGAGLYVASNVRVREAGSRTVVETPFGTLRVRQGGRFNPAEFGVPVYPGAVHETDQRKLASFEFDLGGSRREFSLVAAEYTTADSAERVAGFYREQLPGWRITRKTNGVVEFQLSSDGRKRAVAIRVEDGRTHIGLASVGEPASN